MTDGISLLRERAAHATATKQRLTDAQQKAVMARQESAQAWSGVLALLHELAIVESQVWQRSNDPHFIYLVAAIDEARVDYGVFLTLAKYLKETGQFGLIPAVEKKCREPHLLNDRVRARPAASGSGI